MIYSKFQLEMLYNKLNVYGLDAQNEVELNFNTVYLYLPNKVVTLKWREDKKDWVNTLE